MLQGVADRLGISAHLVENTMTVPQIELHYSWILRETARAIKATLRPYQHAVTKAIHHALTGKDPG